MAPRPDQSPRPSRRSVVTAGSSLLAGFGLSAALPAAASAAPSAPAAHGGAATHGPAAEGDLAAYRPVLVSSTAYAPTPGEFVVDKVATGGVRGTGWRAADGDPQWVSVDLQAVCEVALVRLTFEAAAGDPVFVPNPNGNWSDGTTGQEILSSYATAFTVETSLDGTSWSPRTSGTYARYVRVTLTRGSDTERTGIREVIAARR